MTSRWSKEDRAAWDSSEVVQELEKKVLRVISSLDNILKNSGTIDDLKNVGDSAAGVQGTANAVANLATSVNDLNQASAADDAMSLQKLGEELVAAYNILSKEEKPEGDDLVHYDLMHFDDKFDLNDEGGVLWVIAGAHPRIKSAVKSASSGVDLLTIEGRLKVVAGAIKGMANDKSEREQPCHSNIIYRTDNEAECEGEFISNEDSKLRIDNRKNEILNETEIDFSHIDSLATSTSLATSEKVEDETSLQPDKPSELQGDGVSNEVDDKLRVVARLRGLLKEATDKREIKLAYKIERTIDEILEEG
jgi:hypothetical protein